MKKILQEKTLSQLVKFSFWKMEKFFEEFNKRTYYRILNEEVKPQPKTVLKLSSLLWVDEKTIAKAIENELKK